MSRRRLILACAFACATLAVIVPASIRATSGSSAATPAFLTASAPSPYADRIGISSHLLWLSQSEAQNQLARLHAGGVTWVREDFRWDRLEPQRGTYDWSRTDRLMSAAAATSVNVLALITNSPAWASGAADPAYPPRSSDDFAAFAAAVVSRYGTGGAYWRAHPTVVPRPITAAEIWNEPYGRWAWKPNPDPAAYAVLARKAAVAIHAIRSDVTVLVSGDVIQQRSDGRVEVPWLASLLADDPQLANVVDAFSVHPYSDDRGPYDAANKQIYRYDRVALAHDIEVAHGVSLPIWITETGWSTGAGGVSEATQAEFVRGAVVRAIQEWGSFVPRIFVFSWDVSAPSAPLADGYGLRRPDGSTRPAWTELVNLLAPLTSSAATTPVTSSPPPSPVPAPSPLPPAPLPAAPSPVSPAAATPPAPAASVSPPSTTLPTSPTLPRGSHAHAPAGCRAPSVVGRTRRAAVREAVAGGCTVGLVRYSRARGSGRSRVIAQTPSAGSFSRTGRLDLVVSRSTR